MQPDYDGSHAGGRPVHQVLVRCGPSRRGEEDDVIKGFGTLCAGHVDFEDLGFDATPVNARRLPNERLIEVFGKATAIAETMDRLGYDTLWLAEHHFQPEGYECIPNI